VGHGEAAPWAIRRPSPGRGRIRQAHNDHLGEDAASPPAGKPEPLRAIQYKPEQPPAGLDPERWVRLTKLIASIRKIAPSDVGFDGGA